MSTQILEPSEEKKSLPEESKISHLLLLDYDSCVASYECDGMGLPVESKQDDKADPLNATDKIHAFQQKEKKNAKGLLNYIEKLKGNKKIGFGTNRQNPQIDRENMQSIFKSTSALLTISQLAGKWGIALESMLMEDIATSAEPGTTLKYLEERENSNYASIREAKQAFNQARVELCQKLSALSSLEQRVAALQAACRDYPEDANEEKEAEPIQVTKQQQGEDKQTANMRQLTEIIYQCEQRLANHTLSKQEFVTELSQMDEQLYSLYRSSISRYLESTSSTNKQQEKKNNDDFIITSDDTKILLLYAHIQRAAVESKGQPIEIHFFDDKIELLNNLKQFFTQHPELIPKNTTLHFLQYAPNRSPFNSAQPTIREPQLIGSICGTGICNSHYAQTIRNINQRVQSFNANTKELMTFQYSHEVFGLSDKALLERQQNFLTKIDEQDSFGRELAQKCGDLSSLKALSLTQQHLYDEAMGNAHKNNDELYANQVYGHLHHLRWSGQINEEAFTEGLGNLNALIEPKNRQKFQQYSKANQRKKYASLTGQGLFLLGLGGVAAVLARTFVPKDQLASSFVNQNIVHDLRSANAETISLAVASSILLLIFMGIAYGAKRHYSQIQTNLGEEIIPKIKSAEVRSAILKNSPTFF